MNPKRNTLIVAVVCLALVSCSGADEGVQLGPRPYYLISDMSEGQLKATLAAYQNGPFQKSDFSIGHRGACMQFPEHTKESYEAAARMGAGIVECDVTFTKDRVLVCRHSQCDLHTTTNILAIPELAAKCSEPFTPAVYDANGTMISPASARCCTSDITLEEFRMLKGKMDGADRTATTVGEYMYGAKSTAEWRTDLYNASGTLMTHAESIELFKKLGVKMTPELKGPSVEMPYEGDYTQEMYAQQMIDEYKAAGIEPKDVYAQSFNLNDVLFWLDAEPEFGAQGVFLDGRYSLGIDPQDPTTWNPGMNELRSMGVNIIAPPMWMLLAVDENDSIVASEYAKAASAAGLAIITWTFERSDLRNGGEGDWYYQTTGHVIEKPGDKMEVLDVLAQDVGVIGVFSDWPAAVTYYANVMGLGLSEEN